MAIVVECDRCRWSIGGFARSDDGLIGEGLARARKCQHIDQEFLARWLRAEQGSALLERQRQSLVDALRANAGLMDGFLTVKLLPQRQASR